MQHEAPPLAQKLTAFRKKQGLTMQQLGEAVGVTESYISFLESGQRRPSRKLIKKLIAFYYPQGHADLQDEWLMLAGFSPENPQQYVPQIHDLPQEFSPDLDLRSRFAQIRNLIKAQHYEEATRHIQKCFQLYQGAVEIQSLVGSLELAKRNYQNAIQAQQTAIQFYLNAPEASHHLKLPDLYLSLGVSYFLAGYEALQTSYSAKGNARKQSESEAKKQFKAASEQFKRALDSDPDDIYILDEYARVSFNLAHLSRQAEAWQETQKAYHQVLLHPDNRLIGSEALLEAALFRAHAFSKGGAFDAALDILSLIQAIRPEYWLAHYARACLHCLRFQQSAQAEELSPELDQGLLHLARALQLAPQHKAREEAQRDPDLAPLREQRPQAFARLIHPGEALP